MKEESEILDRDLIDLDKGSTFLILKWWEDKRMLYNGILITGELFLMIMYWMGTLRFGILEAIIWSILYTLVANVFYSIGWMLEIFLNYYFPKIYFNSTLKNMLWLSGLVFSIFLTWEWYETTLNY